LERSSLLDRIGNVVVKEPGILQGKLVPRGATSLLLLGGMSVLLTKTGHSVIFFSNILAYVRTCERLNQVTRTSLLNSKEGSDMGAKAKKEKNNKIHQYIEIRKDLENQRSTLLTEAGVIIGGGLNPNQENLSDVGDQATAVADQNFLLRLKEREQKLLKKIDEALERITKGEFGICESCGGEIGFKRLKARPVTTLCIECKTKQEEEEKVRQ
jgi:DnaK suppressor protein